MAGNDIITDFDILNWDSETLPTGNPLMVLYRFMGSTSNLDILAKNWGDAERSDGRIVFHLNSKAKIVITFREDLMPRSKKSRLESYFIFLMCKIADTAIDGGKLIKEEISFKVQETVDCGMFTDYRNAKRSIDELSDFISKIHVDFVSSQRTIYSNPIHYIERNRGDVNVTIEKKADWVKLTKQFLPISRTTHALEPQPLRMKSIIDEWIRINAKRCGAGPYEIPLEEVVRRIAADFYDSRSAARAFNTYIKEPVKELNEQKDRLRMQIELNVPDIKDPKKRIREGWLTVIILQPLADKLIRIQGDNLREAYLSGKL